MLAYQKKTHMVISCGLGPTQEYLKTRDMYLLESVVCSPVTPVTQVTAFCVVLLCKEFNPEKYEVLCGILGRLYMRTGSPCALLSTYLSVIIKGVCDSKENGVFAIKDFDIRQAYVFSSIKNVILKFGIESILLYTGLILKKRIVVYHSNVYDLLSIIRALPTFVWHRQNWNILIPYLQQETAEIEDLTSNSSYIAGFTDASIESRTDLYDLFVNLSAGEITVPQHSKDAFGMGKLHKDIALFMVDCAEDEDKSDQQVIKEIALKTKELLSNLRSLAVETDSGKAVITLDVLKERNMPAATENFLFSLAAAEGFVET